MCASAYSLPTRVSITGTPVSASFFACSALTTDTPARLAGTSVANAAPAASSSAPAMHCMAPRRESAVLLVVTSVLLDVLLCGFACLRIGRQGKCVHVYRPPAPSPRGGGVTNRTCAAH